MHTNIWYLYDYVVPSSLTAEVGDEMSDSDEDQEGKLKPSSANAVSVPLGWPKVTIVYYAEMTKCI